MSYLISVSNINLYKVNFDLLGIILDGTPPTFCERLLRSGRLDTMQGISNEDDSYIVYMHLHEICYESVPLFINVNPFSQMVYRAYLMFADDIGLSHYSRLFDLINERYGDDYDKIPDKEVIGWHFDNGRILLMRSNTTTILVFTDSANNPDNDFDDIYDENGIDFIE